MTAQQIFAAAALGLFALWAALSVLSVWIGVRADRADVVDRT